MQIPSTLIELVFHTSLRAVLDPLPILCPLLTPFKRQAASLTNLRWESVLCLGFSCHQEVFRRVLMMAHAQ